MRLPFPAGIDRVYDIIWGSGPLPEGFRPCVKEGLRVDKVYYAGVLTYVAVRLYAALAGGLIDRRTMNNIVNGLSNLTGVRCNPSWKHILEYDPVTDTFQINLDAYIHLFSPNPLDPEAVKAKAGNPEYALLTRLLRDAVDELGLAGARTGMPRILESSIEILLTSIVGESILDKQPGNAATALVSRLLGIIASRHRHRVEINVDKIIEYLEGLAKRGSVHAVESLYLIALRTSVTRGISVSAIKGLVKAWLESENREASDRALERLVDLMYRLPHIEANITMREILEAGVGGKNKDRAGRGLMILVTQREGEEWRGPRRELRSIEPLRRAIREGMVEAAYVTELLCARGGPCRELLKDMIEALSTNTGDSEDSVGIEYQLVLRRAALAGKAKEITRIILEKPSIIKGLLERDAGVRLILDLLQITSDRSLAKSVLDGLEQLLSKWSLDEQKITLRPHHYMYKKIYAKLEEILGDEEEVYERLSNAVKNVKSPEGKEPGLAHDILRDIEWARRIMEQYNEDGWFSRLLEEKIEELEAGDQRALWTLMDVAIISGDEEVVEKIVDVLASAALRGDPWGFVALAHILVSKTRSPEIYRSVAERIVGMLEDALTFNANEHYLDTVWDSLLVIPLSLHYSGEYLLAGKAIQAIANRIPLNDKLFEITLHLLAILPEPVKDEHLEQSVKDASHRVVERILMGGDVARLVSKAAYYKPSLLSILAGKIIGDRELVEKSDDEVVIMVVAALAGVWSGIVWSNGKIKFEELVGSDNVASKLNSVLDDNRLGVVEELLFTLKHAPRIGNFKNIIDTIIGKLSGAGDDSLVGWRLARFLHVLGKVDPILALEEIERLKREGSQRLDDKMLALVYQGVSIGAIMHGYSSAIVSKLTESVDCKTVEVQDIDELMTRALEGDLCSLAMLLQLPPRRIYDGYPLLWLIQ